MQPRFVGRLGLADAVTVANAGLGFVAVVAATVDPVLAAQLLLVAAIADGLDGVVARYRGSTPVGEYLDSLADVGSFSVAPALFVVAVGRDAWGFGLDPRTAIVIGVPAVFVAVGVIRLGLYTAYDLGNASTQGMQTTLAATLLAAGYLAGLTDPAILLAATALFCYLMVAPIRYPELYARDALAMGALQALAVALPMAFGRLFPRALLAAALAYAVLAPRYYWREPE